MNKELTQEEKIINYMSKHGSITALEATEELYITQFHTRMKELKEVGWVFADEWEKNRNTGTKYKRYRIAKRPKKVKKS